VAQDGVKWRAVVNAVMNCRISYKTVECSIQLNGAYQKTPWSKSARELHRLSDRRLSTKLVPTFADIRCPVVRVTDPYGRILGFLDRETEFIIFNNTHYCRISCPKSLRKI
jgi:hypothetical protein